MTKAVDLEMGCGDCQQFCIDTAASEIAWESKRFSGAWKNFGEEGNSLWQLAGGHRWMSDEGDTALTFF